MEKYKLELDTELDLTWAEKAIAFDRLGRFGVWCKFSEWWAPCESLMNPTLKIEREGFIILEKKAINE